MRRVIAALVVVGLAVGVVLLWPRAASDEPSETVAGPTTTTSTSTTLTDPTTTTGPTTTSTVADDGSHVVETVEEAETILRELWFGWFEGIYNQDEERIREVVGNPDLVASGIDLFGVMEFEATPQPEAISVRQTELLRSDKDCLAAWATVSATFRDGSIEGVHVFQAHSGRWLLINTWPLRDDLWEADCDVVLEP